MSKPIHISEELHEQINEYAARGEMGIRVATEKLLTIAFGRLAALANYSKAKTGKVPTPRNPKQAAKKTAKKVAKKTSKRVKKVAKKAAKKVAKKAAKKSVPKAVSDAAQKVDDMDRSMGDPVYEDDGRDDAEDL